MEKTEKSYFEQQLDKLISDHYKPEYYYLQARQSKAFMEQNLSKKIELEHIAAAACMSRFHFIRIFKNVYGTTPREYLRSLRIRKARELLMKGISVAQVCLDVGYESFPTFSATFKRCTGHSPRGYQQLNKAIWNK